MKSLIGLFFLFSSNAYAKPLPCSSKKTINFAFKSASSTDYDKSVEGMNILLSLQSSEAKASLEKVKGKDAALGEILEYYIVHFDEHPIEDGATDKIKYYSCKENKKLMKSTK